MSSLFEAYITNLGKYNEGRLVGETLKFPATTEEVQALLKLSLIHIYMALKVRTGGSESPGIIIR